VALQAYKFRIYPSRKQQDRLLASFDLCCGIYNILLSRAREAYEKDGTNLCGKAGMCRIIKEVKEENPEFYGIYSQVLQNCADRLAKAFNNFFGRAKRKKRGEHIKAGYPRFKKRVRSITYPQSGFSIDERKLKVSKIGRIPIVLHREMEGRIKTLTIKRVPSGEWFAILSCEVPTENTDLSKTNHDSPEGESVNREHPNKDKEIGIDLGISSFATMSDGVKVGNPHFLKKAEKRLKRAQRKLSRKEKKSKNRKKAGHRVAVLHEKVGNQRSDFLHKTARAIADSYGLIAVEDLNVKGWVRNRRLSKAISDAGWSEFLHLLSCKAERAGGTIVKVRPNNTSQTCSACGRALEEHIPLSERVFRCPFCGHEEDRDVNAAKNILERAREARPICQRQIMRIYRFRRSDGIMISPCEIGFFGRIGIIYRGAHGNQRLRRYRPLLLERIQEQAVSLNKEL
jgi:putative transposase